MRRAIAFDLDGTLLDVKERDYAIYCDLLLHNGYLPLETDKYWSLRRSRCNIFSLLAMSKLVDESLVSVFLRKRQEMMEQLHYLEYDQLFPDVKTVLFELKVIYDIYLVTTRFNIVNTQLQLENLGLNGVFDEVHIVGKDKYCAYKEIANLDFVVGDTENDICAAQRLQVKAVGVTTGIRDRAFLQDLHPNYIIDNLLELLKICIYEKSI